MYVRHTYMYNEKEKDEQERDMCIYAHREASNHFCFISKSARLLNTTKKVSDLKKDGEKRHLKHIILHHQRQIFLKHFTGINNKPT